MKWLRRIFILHAQSRAPLYHSTPIENFPKIMKDNMLRKSDRHYNLSFSRSKSFNYKKEMGAIIQFKLDQDKIRHNYKLEPFVWHGMEDERKGKNRIEFEEVTNKNLKNLDKYIIEICSPNLKMYMPKITLKHAISNLDIEIPSFSRYMKQGWKPDGSELAPAAGNSDLEKSMYAPMGWILNLTKPINMLAQHKKTDKKTKAVAKVMAKKINKIIEQAQPHIQRAVKKFENPSKIKFKEGTWDFDSDRYNVDITVDNFKYLLENLDSTTVEYDRFNSFYFGNSMTKFAENYSIFGGRYFPTILLLDEETQILFAAKIPGAYSWFFRFVEEYLEDVHDIAVENLWDSVHEHDDFANDAYNPPMHEFTSNKENIVEEMERVHEIDYESLNDIPKFYGLSKKAMKVVNMQKVTSVPLAPPPWSKELDLIM